MQSYLTSNGAENWGNWGEGDDDLTLSTIATRELKLGVWAQGWKWAVPWVRPPTDAEVDRADAELLSMEFGREEMQLRTTLALLQIFHAHTSFQLLALEYLLLPPSERSNNTINPVPKDILVLELGLFSSIDERYCI
ncbi:hypothetical protein F5877DRAFT_85000 [Lentinula edodes]|nr:hypothetical protein F5877DRAFT_85000 [Lentinula edodes]